MSFAPKLKVPSGYALACFDHIDSTNAEALRRAENGQSAPLWIVAKEQSSGRGRRGRTWITASGNLFATLLLEWHEEVAHLSELSFVAAVACGDMLEKLIEKSGCHSEVALKWPNDILLNSAKVGGILIETSSVNNSGESTAVAIGIGLNIAAHPGEALAYPVTDFAKAGLAISAGEVFELLAVSFEQYFTLWQNGAGFSRIKQRWLALGPAIGQKLKINTGSGMITGEFNGLDDHGRLLLRLRDGSQQVVVSGDVTVEAAHTAASGKGAN